MKLISYNIRGLGGLAKKKEIQRLIQIHKLDVICIQETKMEIIERNVCSMMWGSSEFEFAFKPSEG